MFFLTISIKLNNIYVDIISNFCKVESKDNSSKKEYKIMNEIGYNY